MPRVTVPKLGDTVKFLVGLDRREFVGVVNWIGSEQFSALSSAGETQITLYVQGWELVEPGPHRLYPSNK